MSNTPQRLKNRYLAMSPVGKIQSAPSVGILDADITKRHKCTITQEEVILRTEQRDCKGQDIVEEIIQTRGLRFTFAYEEVDPQTIAMWAAYFLGSSAYTAGTPADEVQTLTRSGTVSGGTFTIALTLEGRTVVSDPIAFDATNAEIQAALTATKMKFVQPGDVVVTGTWGTAITLTFGGRLAKANLALVVIGATGLTGSTPGIDVASVTNGEQHYFEIERSADDDKVRFSFVLGWTNVTNRAEKYVGFACESFTENLDRRQNVKLSVSVVGPWSPELLTSFSIPACVSPTAALTADCKIMIDSNWETTDVQTAVDTLNDNVPVDADAAFGFDDVDIQDLERGDQPAYSRSASIFGSEVDHLYDLALNERTQDPVDYTTHIGMPGNRFSLISDLTKIKFQTNRLGSAGTLNKSTINIDGTPYGDGVDAPVRAEAYLDQAVNFLVVSS